MLNVSPVLAGSPVSPIPCWPPNNPAYAITITIFVNVCWQLSAATLPASPTLPTPSKFWLRRVTVSSQSLPKSGRLVSAWRWCKNARESIEQQRRHTWRRMIYPSTPKRHQIGNQLRAVLQETATNNVIGKKTNTPRRVNKQQ